MDVAGSAVNNGTNIRQYTYNGSDAQKFGFVKVNGTYRIVTKVNYGTKNLSLASPFTTNGANIRQWSYCVNDFWVLEKAEWMSQSARFDSGEMPTAWDVDLGDGVVTFGFVKRYSAKIEYQYNSKQITLNYIENYTSIQQTHPVSVVGTVSAVNARAVVNDEMLIMYGCPHDGHIVAPGAFACNSFYPSITNLIGNTTINTYGFVNVPGPPLVGSAVCIDNSYQCFITITL